MGWQLVCGSVHEKLLSPVTVYTGLHHGAHAINLAHICMARISLWMIGNPLNLICLIWRIICLTSVYKLNIFLLDSNIHVLRKIPWWGFLFVYLFPRAYKTVSKWEEQLTGPQWFVKQCGLRGTPAVFLAVWDFGTHPAENTSVTGLHGDLGLWVRSCPAHGASHVSLWLHCPGTPGSVCLVPCAFSFVFLLCVLSL